MARDIRAMALAISAQHHKALQILADTPMSDDTARIDRLEREVAELRRELQRIAQETAWVRSAESLTPSKPSSIGLVPGEPLDWLPMEYKDEPVAFTKMTRDGDPV